jgi:hypothetical protein
VKKNNTIYSCINAQTFSVLFLCIGLSFYSEAQNPRLRFLKNSAGIADDILITLTFSHLAAEDVFFPKNGSYFKPFELVNSVYFTTKTIDSISTDSILYTIKSYEVDSIKSLALPVWTVKDGDSTVFWSNIDSLFFKGIIPDSLLHQTKLHVGIDFIKRKERKMSGSLKIFLACLLLLSLLVIAFLDRIRAQINLLKYRKKQNDFIERFKKIMLGSASSEELRDASFLWRNHMTWLEDLPFNTLSSVEIEKTAKDKKVGEAIRELEINLFGGINSDLIPVALQILFSYSKERFREKMMEYKKRISKRH